MKKSDAEIIKVQNWSASTITLGDLLELVSFHPENVEKFQEELIENSWTQLCLVQDDVPEDRWVWDGAIVWNAEKREFTYVGADGPGGGGKEGVSLPLTLKSVFEIV